MYCSAVQCSAVQVCSGVVYWVCDVLWCTVVYCGVLWCTVMCFSALFRQTAFLWRRDIAPAGNGSLSVLMLIVLGKTLISLPFQCQGQDSSKLLGFTKTDTLPFPPCLVSVYLRGESLTFSVCQTPLGPRAQQQSVFVRLPIVIRMPRPLYFRHLHICISLNPCLVFALSQQ